MYKITGASITEHEPYVLLHFHTDLVRTYTVNHGVALAIDRCGNSVDNQKQEKLPELMFFVVQGHAKLLKQINSC